MKPTEIWLAGGAFPLPDTFERVELEMAAAMLIIACAYHEDRWQPVTAPMIGLAMKANLRARREPWYSLDKNRACPAPSFYGLVDKGYARFTSSDKERSPIELTDKGLDLIRAKWWRPSPAAEVSS